MWNTQHYEFLKSKCRLLPINEEKRPYKGYRWKADPPAEWTPGKGESGFGIVIPMGYVVIDLDVPPENASQTPVEWFIKKSKMKMEDVPYFVKTPRGHHLWFLTGEHEFINNASMTTYGVGVDIRAAGMGYVVGPGSQCYVKGTKVKAEYVAVGDFDAIPVIPESLVKEILHADEQSSAKPGRKPSQAAIESDSKLSEGSRNDALKSAVFAVTKSTHFCKESLIEWAQFANETLMAKPLEISEVKAMVNSAWRKRDPSVRRDGIWIYDEVDSPSLTTYRTRLLRKGLAAFGFDPRYDMRSEAFQVFSKDRWRPLRNNEINRWLMHCRERIVMGIRPYLDKKGKINVTKPFTCNWSIPDWEGSLAIMVEGREIDAFVTDFLAPIKKRDDAGEIDQTPVINELFSHFFNVEGNDPVMLEYAAKNLLLGILERAKSPGIKHDQMVVLIGPEGCFKSTFCEALLPPDRREWFLDDFSFESPKKEMIEKMLGKVIIETAEMQNLTGRNKEFVKSLLSGGSDKVRLSFRRDAEDFPRRSVFVGTSNNARVLPHDPKGNRRFIPIRVDMKEGFKEREDFIKAMDSMRDRIWAEAMRLYESGERGQLPYEHRQIQLQATRLHSYEPDLEYKIRVWISECNEPSFYEEDLHKEMNIPSTMQRNVIRKWIKGHPKVTETRRAMRSGVKQYLFILGGDVNEKWDDMERDMSNEE